MREKREVEGDVEFTSLDVFGFNFQSGYFFIVISGRVFVFGGFRFLYL